MNVGLTFKQRRKMIRQQITIKSEQPRLYPFSSHDIDVIFPIVARYMSNNIMSKRTFWTSIKTIRLVVWMCYLLMLWFLWFDDYLLLRFHFSSLFKSKAHTHVTVILTLLQIITIGKKHFFGRLNRYPKRVWNWKLLENYGICDYKRSEKAKKHPV